MVAACPADVPVGRSAHFKVGATVIAVTAYGVLVSLSAGSLTAAASSNLVFFVLLMLNTYFSVTYTESKYHVRCLSDEVFNVPLAALYLAFPWLTRETFWFYLAMSIFFSLAMMKYANWLTRIEAGYFLRRKILANGFGCVLCGVGAAVVLIIGETTPGAWMGVLVFGYANVHTLWIDPLYRHAAAKR